MGEHRFHDPDLARMAEAAAATRATMAWQDALDHEVVFLIAVTFGVVALLAFLTWGAKSFGLHGVSSTAQHP